MASTAVERVLAQTVPSLENKALQARDQSSTAETSMDICLEHQSSAKTSATVVSGLLLS